MLFSTPCGNFKPTKAQIDALDKLLILHADHEQNASTSTVKMAGSSGANPFACIAAGVASLWGPAHGGANESVIRMLYEIKDEKNIASYIKRAKDKHAFASLHNFESPEKLIAINLNSDEPIKNLNNLIADIKNFGKKIIKDPLVNPAAIKPEIKKNLIYILIYTIGIAGLVTYLFERFDNVFHNVKEVEKFINLPILGFVPFFNFKEEGSICLKRKY